MNLAALRATTRIARRDAWRHRSRSALIVLMIAIPVMGLVGADVLARTMQLSSAELTARDIGTADAALQFLGGVVKQGANPFDGEYTPASRPLRSGTPRYARLERRVLATIGATEHVTVAPTSRRINANGLAVPAEVQLADLNSPLLRGTVLWRGGRAPTGPTDVAVSTALASRLGVQIGDTVRFNGTSWRISGLISDPLDLSGEFLDALPGAFPLRSSFTTVFVRTSRPVTWPQVLALNQVGVAVASKAVFAHPPTTLDHLPGFRDINRNRIGIATVAIGLAILEATLLAAAAFAVGARRQRRDLALLAAAGGDARRMAQVVLASGAVLGIVGAVVGTPLGLLVAKIALPHVAHLADRAPGHFDVRGLELVGVMVLGVVTGLIAAMLPARAAARDDVVGALAGRRPPVSIRNRLPVVGAVFIAVGAAVAVQEARSPHFRWILAGAVVCELGFVMCAPTIVGWCGHLASRLPLAPRLALRDASRHRGRTGPAVAAVLAAVAGTVAVSAYIVSQTDHGRATYRPAGRIGQPALTFFAKSVTPAQRAATIADVRRDLDSGPAIPLRTALCQVTAAGTCNDVYFGALDRHSAVAVGGAATLRTLTGAVDPKALGALRAGGLVEFDSGAAGAGSSVIGSGSFDGRTAQLPRYRQIVGARGAAVAGIVSPATAARLDLRTEVATYLLPTSGSPSQRQEERATEQIPVQTTLLRIERGYDAGKYPVGELVLAIAAALVTLGATAVSLGLSMAETRPDLAILTAVGSRPGTRRTLVASQAGTIALLGGVMGVVAGVLPAWAILQANGEVPFVMPWSMALLTVVAIPAVAMVVSAAFAGSSTHLDRRVT